MKKLLLLLSISLMALNGSIFCSEDIQLQDNSGINLAIISEEEKPASLLKDALQIVEEKLGNLDTEDEDIVEFKNLLIDKIKKIFGGNLKHQNPWQAVTFLNEDKDVKVYLEKNKALNLDNVCLQVKTAIQLKILAKEGHAKEEIKKIEDLGNKLKKESSSKKSIKRTTKLVMGATFIAACVLGLAHYFDAFNFIKTKLGISPSFDRMNE